MTSFENRVLLAVKKIPRGKTITYKQIAARAGSPRAYRAVGSILNRYDSSKIKVPCHRVVRSDGRVGQYRFGSEKKLRLLSREGVVIFQGKVVIKSSRR